MKKTLFFIMVLMSYSIVINANDVLPAEQMEQFADDGEGPPVEDPPPPAPIDQWIVIMTIAGICFVGYKTIKIKTDKLH